MEEIHKAIEVVADAEEHVDKWLERFREQEKILPQVLEVKDRLRWEYETLQTHPTSLGWLQPIQPFLQNREAIVEALPLVDAPPYSLNLMLSGTTATSGLVTLASPTHALESTDPGVRHWGRTQIGAFDQMHEKFMQAEQVKKLVARHSEARSAEFQDGERAYYAAIAGTGPIEAAGITMRNLGEHLLGDLWARAKTAKEQKLDWEIIAERLCVGGKGSKEHTLLSRQGIEWTNPNSGLHTALTKLAKNLTTDQLNQLKAARNRYLDWLRVVLNLIKV